ncbi:hypothetical protein CPB85DRAFT_645260 [Mucidula mucida]|nr:hypothetical protein CPB85DRAFT_645260 [Mucidula mucida]
MPYLHRCCFCPLSFPVKYELLRKEHFVCSTCKPIRSFATAESLKEHYRGSPHHPNCSECGIGFQDDKERDAHLRSHERNCQNRNCRVYKVYERALQAHYQDSFRHPTCELCGEGVFDSTALTEHYRAKHGHCEQCGEAFLDAEALERHFNNHPDHVCHLCGRGFPTKMERDTHTHSSTSPQRRQSISSSCMPSVEPDGEAVAWVDLLVCEPRRTALAATNNVQSGTSSHSTGKHSTPGSVRRACYCRLCGRDAFHGMSTTSCGHIFCSR